MNVTDVTPRAMEAMIATWPGNIRELSNAIERAMLFCDGEAIDLPDLPAACSQGVRMGPDPLYSRRETGKYSFGQNSARNITVERLPPIFAIPPRRAAKPRTWDWIV